LNNQFPKDWPLLLYSFQAAAENDESGTEDDHAQWLGQEVRRKGAGTDEIGKCTGIDQWKDDQYEYQGNQYGCFLHDSFSCYDQLDWIVFFGRFQFPFRLSRAREVPTFVAGRQNSPHK
jgi:hypothetical protein